MKKLACSLAFLLTFVTLVTAQRGYRHYGRPVVYAPYRGQHFYYPHFYGGASIMIPFSGINYYYGSGYFYRPYGSYFSLVAPPIGISIGVLPYGYRRIYVGADPFFYFNGTYYRQTAPSRYQVIDAPVGAEVPELPKGAKVTVIDNQKYYELDGNYYQESIRSNGEIWYRVMGKNGVLNTGQQPAQAPPPAAAPSVRVGDKVDRLPAGSKTIVLNGQKLHVAPDNTYYEEVIENNTISYKVVGIPANTPSQEVEL